MKTIRIVLLAIVFSFSIFSYGQNNLFSINQFGSDLKIIGMEIDSTFYSSGLVYSITNGSISGLSVTDDFKLYSYEGYIRILLSDLGVYGYTVRCGDNALSGKLIIMR